MDEPEPTAPDESPDPESAAADEEKDAAEEENGAADETEASRTWTRRRFLKVGVLGGLLIGAGVVYRWNTTGYDVEPALEEKLTLLGPKEYLVVEAIAARMCRTDSSDAPDPSELGIGLAIDDYLQRMPAWLQEESLLLINALEHTPLIFTGDLSRFTRLSGAEQDACIRAWKDSSLATWRQGYQGIKALCMYGYYRHPKSWPVLGYKGPPLSSERGRNR